MTQLPDALLIKSYTTAKSSNFSPLFIQLLEIEIRRRSLSPQL
ncbi:sporulation histidine kinase inhibitor Sda [Sporosarcina sp. FSL K6-2383]